MEYIWMDDLEIRATYKCEARNFTYGMWDGEAFLYIREKFNDFFLDKEYHWDEGAPHGTVKPIQKLEA